MSRFLFFLTLFLSFLLLATAHGSGHDDDEDGADHGDSQVGLRSKPLILMKVWCLILVFVGTFIGGVLPYFLKWNGGFLVLGTHFAGGVFFGIVQMHLTSATNEAFEELTGKDYPFAFMLSIAGIVMTMFADRLISYVYGKGRHQCNGDEEIQGSLEQGRKADNGSHLQVHGASANPALATATASSFGDSVLLIVALCFQSVFEGIAVGAAETKADAWKDIWTISLLKIFAAIAMGIALLRMIPDRPFLSCVAYAFAFAISSPSGVAIGAATQGAVVDWIFAISMGLACGAFLYVSMKLILSEGYVPQAAVSVDTPYYKLLALLLGCGVIVVVMIWGYLRRQFTWIHTSTRGIMFATKAKR